MSKCGFSSPSVRHWAVLSLSAVLVLSVPAPRIALAQEQQQGIDKQLSGPIRKGDTVSIIIAGEAALSHVQKVGLDGTVILGLVGNLKIAGLQPTQAAEQIAAMYKKKNILQNPQVVVVITGRPLQSVFISGALMRQGRMTLDDGMRLNEIIEPAGILPSASLNNVSIQRGDKKLTINYALYRAGNDAIDSPNNPLLEDGDKIYIQAQIQVTGTVKLSGEVKTPQLVGVPAGTTVTQALQLAGGLTEFADRDAVVLSRGGQQITVPFKEISEGDRSKDIVLQDKDEIFVRRLVKKTAKIGGEVRMPQVVTLTTGLTATQAIQLAGGVTDNADRKQVLVFRDGKQIVVPFREIQEGNRTGDITLEDKDEVLVKRKESIGTFNVNGGVMRSGSFDLKDKTTLADAIANAGGVMNGVNRKKISIRRKNAKGDFVDKDYSLIEEGSTAIEDGDIIEVGFPKPASPGIQGYIPIITGIASLFYFLRR